MQRRLRLLAALVATALTLAGCVPGAEPAPTPSPTATATAVFASEEEALAAADRVFQDYIAAILTIAAESGSNPDRLSPLVTDELLADEIAGLASYRENGWTGAGTINASLSLQQADLARGNVSAYVCLDYSQYDVLDTNGTSVVPASRPDKAEIVANFVWDGRLRMSGQRAWDGGGVCS